jgi:hypothetical protein
MLQLLWRRRQMRSPLLLLLLQPLLLPLPWQLQLARRLPRPLLLLLLQQRLAACCSTTSTHETLGHDKLELRLMLLLALACPAVLVVLLRGPSHTISTRRVALNLAAHILRWWLRLRQDLPF